jgi:hypothetical protein
MTPVVTDKNVETRKQHKKTARMLKIERVSIKLKKLTNGK